MRLHVRRLVGLLTALALAAGSGACSRKKRSKKDRPADPSPSSAMGPERADPRPADDPDPQPPPRARRPAPDPGSTTADPGPRRAATETGPRKLLALVKALESKGSAAFAPLPLLKNYLTGVGEDHWVHELTEQVKARVLRVGAKPLEAALILFSPADAGSCEGEDGPVAITAVEHGRSPGQSQLQLRKLKTKIRAWFKPKVVMPPHFKKSGAVFVEYAFDADLESCPKNPMDENSPDTRRALFRLGRGQLVLYADYTVDGSGGGAGNRTTTKTRLTWHVSKKQPSRVYLAAVELYARRVFNTEGEQKYEEISCRRSVTVIAMERGKRWNSHRGPGLVKLRAGEPDLAKLPRGMRGKSRKACTL